MTEVRVVADARCTIGEGPIWHPDESALYWVDIAGRAIHRHDPAAGETARFPVDDEIGTLGLSTGSGWIAAGRRGVFRIHLPEGRIEMIADPEAHLPASRFNDGKVDRQGRFWAGTMTPSDSVSALYRLQQDLTLTRMDGPFTITNGIGWSPRGDVMYVVDSMRYVIHRYAFDATRGELGERGDLIRFDRADGIPDGLTVDEQGDVWCAMYGGGAVRRIDTGGTVREVVRLPVTRVTSCAFGGPDYDTLYITSAREGLNADQSRAEPLAGAVFACRPGRTGRPEPRFGG